MSFSPPVIIHLCSNCNAEMQRKPARGLIVLSQGNTSLNKIKKFMTLRCWKRKPDLNSLYDLETCPVQTTIVVDRDLRTGKLIGYREVQNLLYIKHCIVVSNSQWIRISDGLV